MVTKGQWRQYFAAFSCHTSSFMGSLAFSWFTPLIVTLLGKDSEIPMTYDELGWIIAIIEVGEAITPIPTGLLANRWGRKWLLLSSAIMMMIGWIMIGVTRSVLALIIVRLIQGASIGTILVLGPMYVAEIAETNIRGQLTAHFKTMSSAGLLFSYCTGPFLSYQTYVYVGAIPVLVFALTFVWMPETPYFLFMAGRREEAIQSLIWLRGGEDVSQEAKVMEETVKYDMGASKGSMKDLFATKSARKAMFIVCMACLIRYSGGTAAIIAYSTKLLSENAQFIPAEYATIGIGLLLTVTALLSAYLTDVIGRRPLILIGSSGIALFSFIIGVYLYVERNLGWNMNSFVWIFYGSLIGFCLVGNLGLSPILPLLQAEYFTSKSRGPAGALISIASTVMVFTSLKQYQVVEEKIGVFANFFIFSVVCFTGYVVLLVTLVETKQTPLGDVQRETKIAVIEINNTQNTPKV